MKLRSSLRGRLVLVAVSVGVTFALAFGVLATWRVHHARDAAISGALHSRIDLARDEIAGDGTLNQDAGSPKTDLVQVLAPDGTVRSSSDALRGTPPLIDVAAVRASPAGVERPVRLSRSGADLSILAVPVRMSAHGGSPGGTGALVAAVDTEGFGAVTSDLTYLLITGLALVVLAMALLSWLLTGRALRSVTRLTERAETVGASDLTTGLPVPSGDVEVARLVSALNRMLARLHESHAAELAFVAEAGHRLRTPVATLRAEAEIALREPDPAEQTLALERIVRDADQLSGIVDRMLARGRTREHAPEQVSAVLATAVPRWHRQADLADVRLSLQGFGDLPPDLFCRALAEILEPIVENAVRHAGADGHVAISASWESAHGEHIILDVCNTGSTVPAHMVGRVFEAWVSTRDASAAGGLGLWLSRETAREVGGDVTLLHAESGVTTFRVCLPSAARSGAPGETRS
jgi:signal transduction histidine kinase